MLETPLSPQGRHDLDWAHGRKRRHREDDCHDYERIPQRRRLANTSTQAALRRTLSGLAEPSSRRPEDDIDTIVKLAHDLAMQEGGRLFVNRTLQQFVTEQPLRIPFLAGALVLLSTSNPGLTQEIITGFSSSAEESISQGAWRPLKLQLRLLACTQMLFQDDGLFPFLTDLFDSAVQLQSASEHDRLGLELTKIILLTIPYLMSSVTSTSLWTQAGDQARELLQKTDIIASTPHILDPVVDPLGPNQEADQTLNMITLLQQQLVMESDAGWPLNCLARPWINPRTRALLDGSGSAHVCQLSAIRILLPQVHFVTKPYPGIYFSIYARQDVQTVPPPSSIASSLIRDVLTDTICCLNFNRSAVARMLIDVDCYFAPKIFTKRAVPYDQLRELGPEELLYKPEDVALDAIFSLLLALPTPDHPAVYYHSILTEACKIAPTAVAPALGRAIREIYKLLPSLDLELAHRFLDWFSHHLSNFGFTWKWSEWEADLLLPDLHPQKAFIRGLLEKEIRLSFPKRIRANIPPAYQDLITKSNELEVPVFKFNHDNIPFSSEAREIAQLVRKKASDETIGSALQSLSEKAQYAGQKDPILVTTDVFTTAICHIGSKSLSHVLSYIDRCKERLLALVERSDEARQQIIVSVLEYWADQPGVANSIVDKLLNYSIITPSSVVEWALRTSPDLFSRLSQSHVFELVHQTILKVIGRIQLLSVSSHSADESVEALERTSTNINGLRTELKQIFATIEMSLQAPQSLELTGRSSTKGGPESDVLPEWWLGQWRRVFHRFQLLDSSTSGLSQEESVDDAIADSGL